ncbi:hypothetical protein EJ063_03680 [Vibrio aquaticus]|uniref:Uncharacterized protein n=1 Tax=Vibrio aquaticus TaxID=2496559 RepID=A0A432D1U5_9VIBR|nr:hypothetical protein [Vibrio aquaticus]RTZ17899.1 hypothetical protein EJ063_03680 [Vibrio aquaticus]
MALGRKLIVLSLIVTGILSSVVMYGFLVGATCQYSISLHVPEDKRDVSLTCYRGKVVALQTKTASDGRIISKWKVEARQFRFGNQAVYFVYSRVPLITNTKEDSNDRFNQISSGYTFLFYHIVRENDGIYLLQTFPHNYIHKGKIEGFMDFWGMTSRPEIIVGN